MGEIKEKKKSPHFLFVTSASPWDKKCTKKKEKKNLYMNVPCMTQRILGVWQRKKKKNLTYDKAAGNPFTPQLRCRHPPHPTPGFPYP